MDIPQRTLNAIEKREESVQRWLSSSTAKVQGKSVDDCSKITFNKGSMLLSAVSEGDVDETRRLLAQGAEPNFANADGLTSLHQACIDEDIELVTMLVESGAKIDSRDNEGWTPLHAAASTSCIEVVTFLVEHGASLEAVNTDGELPVDLADDDSVRAYLMNYITKKNIDLRAARRLEHSMMMNDIKKWISEGKVKDVRDPQGATTLHVAASKGYMDIIKLLVEDLHVDINAKDFDGWTPLHAAVYWKNMDVVDYLLSHGANHLEKTYVGILPGDLVEDDVSSQYYYLLRKQNKNDFSYRPPLELKDQQISPETYPHTFKPAPRSVLRSSSFINRENDSEKLIHPVKEQVDGKPVKVNGRGLPAELKKPPARPGQHVMEPSSSPTTNTTSPKCSTIPTLSTPHKLTSASPVDVLTDSKANSSTKTQRVAFPEITHITKSPIAKPPSSSNTNALVNTPKPKSIPLPPSSTSVSTISAKSTESSFSKFTKPSLPPNSSVNSAIKIMKPPLSSGPPKPPLSEIGSVSKLDKSDTQSPPILTTTSSVGVSNKTIDLHEALTVIDNLRNELSALKSEHKSLEKKLESMSICDTKTTTQESAELELLKKENKRLITENAALIKAISIHNRGSHA